MGKKHSEDTKRKISEARRKNPTRYWLGKKHSEETKRKMSDASKGMPKSKEHIRKMSLALKGRKTSIEAIKKRVESRKGYQHSEETREKISQANKGQVSWSKGKTYKELYGDNWEIQKKKRGISIKKAWDKKGRKQYKRPKHDGVEYTKWRSDVFARDNWMCQTCGKRSGIGEPVYLEAHHIKYWAKYPELRFDLENGVTLCRECHKLIHKKYIIHRKNKKYGKEI